MPNKVLILITGLPASAKSFLAKKLAEEAYNRGKKVGLVDDLSIKPKRKWATLKNLLEGNKELILVTDPWIVDEEKRQNLAWKLEDQFPEVFVTYIFFENNPTQCLINAELRSNGRKVTKFIERMSKCYKIPRGFAELPVWRP